MDNAFEQMMRVLLNDQNIGVDIVYRPKSGPEISCRGVMDEDTVDVTISPISIRDRSRVLLVSMADIVAPQKGDAVEVPAGGAAYRVFDFTASDPNEKMWRLELGAK